MNKEKESNKEENVKWMEEYLKRKVNCNMGDFNARTEEKRGRSGDEGERMKRKRRNNITNGVRKELQEWLSETGLNIVKGTE